jgi:hypothetical protein
VFGRSGLRTIAEPVLWLRVSAAEPTDAVVTIVGVPA